jgi:dihydroorotate dehydrogenase (NAD+) catalytic subunit
MLRLNASSARKSFRWGKFRQRAAPRYAARHPKRKDVVKVRPDLSVEIAGIQLQNPVMNAAGTLDIEPEYVKDLVRIDKIGAYVHKSTTLKSWSGNPQPRIYEVMGGLINRIGIQNIGVKRFLKEKLPKLRMLGIPIIVSVAGESIKDYCQTSIILQEEAGEQIAGLEINVSCPNIKNGLIFGSDAKLLFNLVSSIRAKVALTLIVKLGPNVTDIGLMGRAAVSAGANALSLINTLKAAAFIRQGPNSRQWIEGGFSGPAIKPVALFTVRKVAKAVNVPIIGMGGICDTKDALDFLRIPNVWAIAVGTATFRDPLTMVKIVEGLEGYMRKKGYANIAELKEKEAC